MIRTPPLDAIEILALRELLAERHEITPSKNYDEWSVKLREALKDSLAAKQDFRNAKVNA